MTQLARALGFTYQALAKWQDKWESCPQTLDVTDWRKFITRTGAGFYRDKPTDNRVHARRYLELMDGNVSDLIGDAEDRCEETHAKLEAWALKFDALYKEAQQIIEDS